MKRSLILAVLLSFTIGFAQDLKDKEQSKIEEFSRMSGALLKKNIHLGWRNQGPGSQNSQNREFDGKDRKKRYQIFNAI